jgi:hypothetical protein
MNTNIEIGTLVSSGISNTFCEVTEIFPHGGETLYHCHYVDLETGLPKECPDSRCHGEHTCPIHGRNERAADLKIVSENDISGYQQHGMLMQRALFAKSGVVIYRDGKAVSKSRNLRGVLDYGRKHGVNQVAIGERSNGGGTLVVIFDNKAVVTTTFASFVVLLDWVASRAKRSGWPEASVRRLPKRPNE